MLFDADQISKKLSQLKLTDAIRLLERLEIKDTAPEYYYSLRAEVFLRDLNLTKSLVEIEKSIAIVKNWAPAYNIRGNILVEMGEFSEALGSFDQAIILDPTNGDFHFNRGQLRFLLGDWAGGCEDYEFRLVSPLFQPPPEIAKRPLWRGQAEEGKRLLLYWEQGQGDTLQFIRFVHPLLSSGMTVLLEVQNSLHRLLAASFPSITIIGEGQALPDFEYRVPIPSLPWLLGVNLNTFPEAQSAYIRSAEQVIPVELRSAPAVGLVWAGNPNHVNDRQRSIPQEAMLALTQVRGIDFQSVQFGISDKQKQVLTRLGVKDLSSDITDFADTASILETLDLVITVDTSVAHLAGALGKPVWILLPFVPDWRWMLNRSDSPWYPSARLFRQPKRGDWASVLKEVKQALVEFRDQRAANSAA